MTPTPRVDAPFNALISYHYFREPTAVTRVTNHPGLRLIADSGAFSAHTQGAPVNVDAYASWLHQWGHHMYWCASLDVFGDPAATLANFRRLRDHHGLATVPTLHIGAHPTHMDTYAAEGVDFLGLGGMVGMPTNAVLRWLVAVLRYARDHHPTMRFHAWGTTRQDLMLRLPLYSADASSLLAKAYKFAIFLAYDPAIRRVREIPLDGRAPYRHHRLLRATYNTTPDAIARSHVGNRPLLTQLGARAAQLRSYDLQARHRVPPPRWGLNPHHHAPHGTLLHAAETATPALLAITTTPQGAPA